MLDNPHGTAPGLAMEVSPNPFREGGKTSWLVMLPGPPRELASDVQQNHVFPLLRKKLSVGERIYLPHIEDNRHGGIVRGGEKIAGPLRPLVESGFLELGYCSPLRGSGCPAHRQRR